nr:polysaccharide deacetylase family protein [Arthrobacter sunyaminii]
MGTKSARRLPSHHKHKRSLQTFAALLVLSLPMPFLIFEANGWQRPAGVPRTRHVPSRKHSPFRLEYPPSRSPSPPGQTVVSLTFDDGVSGAARAAEILNAVDMKGTVYMNSGLLDETGFMALRQAKGVAGPLI